MMPKPCCCFPSAVQSVVHPAAIDHVRAEQATATKAVVDHTDDHSQRGSRQHFELPHKVVWCHKMGGTVNSSTGVMHTTAGIRVARVSKHCKIFLQTTIFLQIAKPMSDTQSSHQCAECCPQLPLPVSIDMSTRRLLEYS